MEERSVKLVHRLILESRNKAFMTGIKECISFDVAQVVLETTEGRLVIKGDNLHVTRLALEKGEADVEGEIAGIIYSKPAKKSEDSLLSRIFA